MTESGGGNGGQFDIDEIAERIADVGQRLGDFATVAGRWLGDQFQPAGAEGASSGTGHPLDLPTEDQGRALSALDSGRWRVRQRAGAWIFDGDGLTPDAAAAVAGELHARDWITTRGELTLTGRAALGRWLTSADLG
jgi:hypothetical protein